MAKVRAKENCFVDGHYYRAGEAFETDGKIHPFLESLEAPAEVEEKSNEPVNPPSPVKAAKHAPSAKGAKEVI